jgi:hypothetical protein
VAKPVTVTKFRQRRLPGIKERGPALSCRRLQRRTRSALRVYGRSLPAAFAVRDLAEEQARLDLLRLAVRRAVRALGCGGQRKRGGFATHAAFVATPAGARLTRAIAACVRRIERLEATLL